LPPASLFLGEAKPNWPPTGCSACRERCAEAGTMTTRRTAAPSWQQPGNTGRHAAPPEPAGAPSAGPAVRSPSAANANPRAVSRACARPWADACAIEGVGPSRSGASPCGGRVGGKMRLRPSAARSRAHLQSRIPRFENWIFFGKEFEKIMFCVIFGGL
jgi:hypothetical protein